MNRSIYRRIYWGYKGYRSFHLVCGHCLQHFGMDNHTHDTCSSDDNKHVCSWSLCRWSTGVHRKHAADRCIHLHPRVAVVRLRLCRVRLYQHVCPWSPAWCHCAISVLTDTLWCAGPPSFKTFIPGETRFLWYQMRKYLLCNFKHHLCYLDYTENS